METNLKFNSAICTSREQSEKLLALGLKKETADMVHYFSQSLAECWTIVPLDNGEVARNDDLEIPAWSLQRLLMMYGDNYSFFSLENAYSELIHAIAIDIEKGTFNKDYLEDKQ